MLAIAKGAQQSEACRAETVAAARDAAAAADVAAMAAATLTGAIDGSGGSGDRVGAGDKGGSCDHTCQGSHNAAEHPEDRSPPTLSQLTLSQLTLSQLRIEEERAHATLSHLRMERERHEREVFASAEHRASLDSPVLLPMVTPQKLASPPHKLPPAVVTAAVESQALELLQTSEASTAVEALEAEPTMAAYAAVDAAGAKAMAVKVGAVKAGAVKAGAGTARVSLPHGSGFLDSLTGSVPRLIPSVDRRSAVKRSATTAAEHATIQPSAEPHGAEMGVDIMLQALAAGSVPPAVAPQPFPATPSPSAVGAPSSRPTHSSKSATKRTPLGVARPPSGIPAARERNRPVPKVVSIDLLASPE